MLSTLIPKYFFNMLGSMLASYMTYQNLVTSTFVCILFSIFLFHCNLYRLIYMCKYRIVINGYTPPFNRKKYLNEMLIYYNLPRNRFGISSQSLACMHACSPQSSGEPHQKFVWRQQSACSMYTAYNRLDGMSAKLDWHTMFCRWQPLKINSRGLTAMT